MTRRLLLIVCAAAVLGLIGTAPALAAQPYPLNFKTFAFNASDSSRSGTVLTSDGSLQLGSSGLGSLSYVDPFLNYSGDGVDGSGPYVSGTWTSGVTNLFAFNELVSSWNATTPSGTWIQIEVQPQIDDGHWAKWYILGRWSSDDYSFHRTSVGSQGDADGFVSIDTFFTKDHPAIAYRLRATLYRKAGATSGPTLPDYSWVTAALGAGHNEPWVDYTARAVYDYRYNGAGNWPFNAAYAASRGLVADVTALHNLREAEPFIKAGIPLVASVAWESNKLDTAIKSTNGHLMVIGGFTATGNVIAYDPASLDDSVVRHVYDREQFERAWIPASGGIVYLIRPTGFVGLPSLTANNS